MMTLPADSPTVAEMALVGNRWRKLIEDAPLGITITNFQGILLEVNRTLCTLLGRRADELVGHAFNEFTHPEDPTRLNRAMALATGRTSMEKRYLTPSGETICLRISASLVVENGENLLLSICEDITAATAAKAALQREATVDETTGLWNRPATRAVLRRHLAEVSQGKASSLALFFLDLDRFTVVNNSMGHAAGDQLLTEVADRLRAALPLGASLGRTGGDEFVLIVPELEGVADVAAAIRQTVGTSVRLGEREVPVSVSIGIAVARRDEAVGPCADITLMRDADTALQMAKRAGPGRIVTFDDDLRRLAIARLEDEQDLRLALERKELLLHFQPIVGTHPGAGRKVEALVRWQHPTRGLLGPGQFLGVAEEAGLQVDLGRAVLELACSQLAVWRVGDPGMGMAVNVAAEHLGTGTLTRDVLAALDRHAVPASALTLEVTEQTLVDSHAIAAVALGELRAAGVTIAIDDFGTGYSSLAYLRELPVDVLKIDRAFVTGLGTPSNDGALFDAVVALGTSLGLHTVAEGIETEQERDAAIRAGVTYLQGFLLGRPAPA